MNSISQPITLSEPVKTKRGKVHYKNPFQDEDCEYPYYHRLWNELQEKFKSVIERLSRKFISDISSRVKSYEFTGQSIPTFALLAGVNVSDHDVLFQLVKQEIKPITKFPVVSVESHHEISVKPVIERMVQTFLANGEIESKHSDGDADDEEDKVVKRMKKSTCTLTRLKLWYESRKSSEDDRTPLIIIIPDVESFCSRVLNDFFSVLSVYKNKIPFIIILGIATDLNALHQRVSPQVLQDFGLTVFKTQPSLKFLDLVLDEVFLTAHCPFQLHGAVLEQLIDSFKFYNFSVEFFIRGMQFCVIDHFLDSDVNVLCCPVDRIPEVVESLEPRQLNHLLNLPSVCNYNTERKKEKLPSLTKKNIKSELVSQMESLHGRISRFHIAVRCFHVLVKSVSNSDLKTLRHIYCLAMRTDLTKTNEFKECLLRFKFLSLELVVENINTIEELLRHRADDEEVEECLKALAGFRSASEKLHLEDESKSCSPRKRTQSSAEINVTPTKSPKKEPMSGRISLSPRKNLFGSANSSKRESTVLGESFTSTDSFEMNEKEKPTIPDALYETESLEVIEKEKSALPGIPYRIRTVSIKEDSDAEISSSEKLNDPRKSSEVNSPPCTRKSPRKTSQIPETPSVEPVQRLIASACVQNTTATPRRMLNGLLTPSSTGSRSELLKSLRKKAHDKKRPSSVIDKWRDDLVNFLNDNLFKKMLECPTRYAFHEVLMYKNCDRVKNDFTSVNPRCSIDKSLQDPQTVLKCKCCKLNTPGDILSSFPDLCITYKYLQERVTEDVDLKALLENFNYTIVAGADEVEITPEVYNRFQQTLRDLQLMGFIKPHKTKADFVKKVSVRIK